MKIKNCLTIGVIILSISKIVLAQNPTPLSEIDKSKIEMPKYNFQLMNFAIETAPKLSEIDSKIEIPKYNFLLAKEIYLNDLIEDRTEFAAKDEQGFCLLHHQPLKKAIVPIIGYLPSLKDIGDKETFFPNAVDSVLGGCLVRSIKHLALVLQCEQCFVVREIMFNESQNSFSTNKKKKTKPNTTKIKRGRNSTNSLFLD